MKVQQIMTKAVSCCLPDDTSNQAARIMWERDCGFVPVVESTERRRVVGVVTDRDACMAAYTRGQSLPEIRVGDVMSTGIRACKSSDDLGAVEAKMCEAQIHRLPVVDDADQLLGVISLADIAREAARQTGSQSRDVTPAEIGETVERIRQPRATAAAPA